jgi:hypothetical protein
VANKSFKKIQSGQKLPFLRRGSVIFLARPSVAKDLRSSKRRRSMNGKPRQINTSLRTTYSHFIVYPEGSEKIRRRDCGPIYRRPNQPSVYLAIVAISTMVEAMTLARASAGQDLSAEILEAGIESLAVRKVTTPVAKESLLRRSA